uniref:SET domain bifurcated histone lysine methyltransferase 2 n=1 Tax=Suricata suricatta TaxID=37032 RepID=A0A673T1B6_SURSU
DVSCYLNANYICKTFVSRSKLPLWAGEIGHHSFYESETAAACELPEVQERRAAFGQPRRVQPWTKRCVPWLRTRRTSSPTPLLYSSALVECEDHDPSNDDRSFDVESVKKEIQRGRRLTCAFCNKRGATVGCDVKACLKSYHFFCAKNAHAVLQTDRSQGIYKVFCQQHAALKGIHGGRSLSGISPIHYKPKTNRGYGLKRKRGRKKGLSTGVPVQPSETMTLTRFIKEMKEVDGRHTDAIGSNLKIDFLKKCKKVGLLDDLFEEILDKLHLIQERLMDEAASESDYEEIGTSLFDCRLFEDTFINFQAAIENRIDQCEERQQHLKDEMEGLQDLKTTLRSLQEDGELRSSSTSVSSGSSKDYYFLGQE